MDYNWHPTPEYMLGEWPESFSEGTSPAKYVAGEARAIAELLRNLAQQLNVCDWRLVGGALAKLERPNPQTNELPRIIRLYNLLIHDVRQRGLTFDGLQDVVNLCLSTIDLVAELRERCKEPPELAAKGDPEGVFRVRRATKKWCYSAQELAKQVDNGAAGWEGFVKKHIPAPKGNEAGIGATSAAAEVKKADMPGYSPDDPKREAVNLHNKVHRSANDTVVGSFNAQLLARNVQAIHVLPATEGAKPETDVPPQADRAGGGKAAPVKKRSTGKGEAQEKLVAAFLGHHKYESANGGSCNNWEPIALTQLSQIAQTSKSSASRFFDDHFGDGSKKNGHARYRGTCKNDQQQLIVACIAMSGEFRPARLRTAGRDPTLPEFDGD